MRVIALEEHFTVPHLVARIDKDVIAKRGFRPRRARLAVRRRDGNHLYGDYPSVAFGGVAICQSDAARQPRQRTVVRKMTARKLRVAAVACETLAAAQERR